ncbi:xanthine dehydrogenase family protein subunit M [Roseovarius sp. MBR-6]|jgi:CO/xanthine dehydrogenase FAD-binding subunit|uniref:FAD binding domain-containing protein n=1 Tax=Roseovarius sp. MBR-6 TaxID=3156459 RepID=UPI003394D9EE
MVPTSTTDALEMLAETGPRIVAGCTDFFPAQKRGEVIENILDISRVAEFRGIRETDDGWRIGAATTWTEIVRAPLPDAFTGLKQAAREVGSVQIQNRGTLAGNICNASPAADGVPPLLTLDAAVEIVSARGARIVPLERFILGPRLIDLAADEIVSALLIPKVPRGAAGAFVKLGSRRHMVISIAMVAVVAAISDGRVADIRIAVGSCAPVAVRLPELEARLRGMTRDEVAAMDAAATGGLDALSPISDVRGTSEYRRSVVAELCRRAVLQSGGEW